MCQGDGRGFPIWAVRPGSWLALLGPLTAAGVKILQTTDSDNLVSAIIEERDVKTAVCALHSAFATQEGE